MKGITALLRNLTEGEQIDVTGITRANLYMLARRIGIKVRVERFAQGFYVTRLGNESAAELRHVVINDDVEAVKQAKLARLRNLIAEPEQSEAGEPNESSSVWRDIGEHWNEIEGEMVHLEQHYKTKQTRIKE